MVEPRQRGVDRRRVADRLQQVGLARQARGGVADDGLAGEREELLGRLGAEAAAGAGGDQQGGDAGSCHGGTHSAIGRHLQRLAAGRDHAAAAFLRVAPARALA